MSTGADIEEGRGFREHRGPRVAGVLNRHPAVGPAIGLVHSGQVGFFHGSADIASRAPVTEDTVFRIGSITKTSTAIAVNVVGAIASFHWGGGRTPNR